MVALALDSRSQGSCIHTHTQKSGRLAANAVWVGYGNQPYATPTDYDERIARTRGDILYARWRVFVSRCQGFVAATVAAADANPTMTTAATD